MELTGKCKEEFGNWLYKKYELENRVEINRFNEYPEAMQYGVYVDFFDSVGFHIEIMSIFHLLKTKWRFIPLGGNNMYNTRPEARASAINKANEIFNENK